MIEFTLLGTGTSQGIPVIGCACPTCVSDDVRDKRLRCSAVVESRNHAVVIDVGPDFRYQALRHGLKRLDAVVLTHEHNDHVIGLDDLRPFMFMNRKPMPIYGEERVLAEVKKRFAYAFTPSPYPGAPAFDLVPIVPGAIINIGDITLEAIRVMHGSLPILGYVIQKELAYCTDVNAIPPESIDKINGVKYFIVDALREGKHHSHNSLAEALTMKASVNASQTFLIHMSHIMGPTVEWEDQLPEDVFPSYDTLSFELQQE